MKLSLSHSHFPVIVASVATLFTAFASGHSEARESISYISAVEDLVVNTRNGHVHHLSQFDVTFYLHDRQQRFKLDLEPNHDILSEGAQVQILDPQGNIKETKTIARHEHKVYKGSVSVESPNGRWENAGWARIYLKKDGKKPVMEGAFSIHGDHHHIQQRSAYYKSRREMDVAVEEGGEDAMIVYRDSDMTAQGHKELKRDETSSVCGSDDLAFNTDPNHSVFRARDVDSTSWGSMFSKPGKRQSGNIGTGNLRASIGDTSGCPTELQVALIGIATDCTYTAAFSSVAAVQANLVSVVNTASNVYEKTFNIAIGLRNLTISDRQCPTTAPDAARWNIPCSGGTIEDRLDLFSEWRGGLQGGNDGNAYWTLMSTCSTGRSVGLAWLGQVCVSRLTGYGGQSVSGANVVVRTPGEWQVFAHESAHTFGAVHDCDAGGCSSTGASRCCPVSTSSCSANGQYLMSPVSSTGLTDFSPCSIGNICSGIGQNRVRDGCLSSNRNLTTINGAQCGNGIVEAGEDCDCGGEAECGSNSCCDPTTCRFTENSVCDDANDSCCTSCQFRPSGSVCRPGRGECDEQETCSGSSGTCPTDIFSPNGQSCGNGTGLACASGQCTSRNLQCQTVFNPMTGDNFTQSCDTDSCTLTCATDSSRSNVRNLCAALDQNFLDGTPCRSSGVCGNGRCGSERDINNNNSNNSPNGGGSARNWFDNNRSLVIGLAAGLGSLVVLIIACCVVSCCRSSRRKRRAALQPPPPFMGQYYSNNHPQAYPSYPQQAHVPNYGFQRQGSVPMVRYA